MNAQTEPLGYTATYSPEDNKLRLYSTSRLPSELYAQLRAAGFIYAPKQQLFVAPMWTPEREDTLLELCGEIGDEDTSLVQRADTRSDRFEDYSDKRRNDAARAHSAVSAIAGNIPLGQPILVGHHSERHARKDAQRIEDGMRRAVKMWETSTYWAQRAKGVLLHAKYKENASVRARRIKTIEADRRKFERNKKHAEDGLTLWTKESLTAKQALFIAGNTPYGFPALNRPDNLCWRAYDVLLPDGERYSQCPAWTVKQVQAKAQEHYPAIIQRSNRWIAHCDNRLTYEKTLLEKQGASDLIAPKPRPKQPPLCNYRAPDGLDIPNCYNRGEADHYSQVEMTQAEYTRINKDYKGTRVIGNSHRVRTALHGQGCKRALVCVFLTDSKVHEPPAATQPPLPDPPRFATHQHKAPEPTVFDAMRGQLRNGGVKVVCAPQLFPTPKLLARQIIYQATDNAGCAGLRALEPSAGTGVFLDAIIDSATGADCCRTVAVEINSSLAKALESKRDSATQDNHRIVCADFLECTPDQLGLFNLIIMNPPFASGADIEHVTHALKFLKAGGRLKAIMSNGVTFRDDRAARTFRALVEARGGTIEPLPDNTFQESGTAVKTILLTIDT